jgi:hypothetical protein
LRLSVGAEKSGNLPSVSGTRPKEGCTANAKQILLVKISVGEN